MRLPAHVEVDDRQHTLRCACCFDEDSIPHRIRSNPELRLEFVELWALDHRECDKFRDAAKAKSNREFRKEHDRRKLLEMPPRRAWIM